jgi:dipeptidyl aminopeptidase/acylaminoacyl peptidase
MFARLLIAFVASILFANVSFAAPPIQAYGRLPSIDHVAISPDGANLAFVTGDDTRRQLQVIRLKDGNLVDFSDVTKSKVRNIAWAGPHQLLIESSKTEYSPFFGDDKHEFATLIVHDLISKKWTVLLDGRKDALPMILNSPSARIIDGKPFVFFESYEFRDGFQGHASPVLYRTDLTTDATSIVERGAEYTEDWVLDSKGKAVGRIDYDQKKGLWSLWVKPKDSWIQSRRVDAKIDVPSVYGLNADGSALLVHEPGAYDVAVWHEVSLADGSWSPEITALKGASGLLFDPRTVTAIGRIVPDDDLSSYKFDRPKDQQVWNAINRAFPGETVDLTDWTDDRSQILVHVQGQSHGDAYFVVDVTSMKAVFLSEEYAGIGPGDVNPVQRVDYAAQDGLKIPAYLTTPKGQDPKGLPLVVLVHGGPAARDVRGFDWWAQALASSGYAVLQPQFRGSTGFGEKHLTSGYGEWGRKMQTDVSDGVRALAAKGIVDPKRVCIAGASYGGYAAMAGAALDPEPYRCAIAVAGISDVRRMLRYEADDRRYEENSSGRYWLRFMGLTAATDPKADEISPLAHLDRVTMPILLIHGLDDTVVPYEQSKLMADALRRAGKPVEFVTLNAEDHWLSKSATRLQMLQEMVRFLAVHNPANPAPAVPKPAAAAAGR